MALQCRVSAIAVSFVVMLHCCECTTDLPCTSADVACKTDVQVSWLQAGSGSAASCQGGLLDFHSLAWPLPALVCTALLFSSSKLGHAAHLSTTVSCRLASSPLMGYSVLDSANFVGVWPGCCESKLCLDVCPGVVCFPLRTLHLPVHARHPICKPLAIQVVATWQALLMMCMSALTLPAGALVSGQRFPERLQACQSSRLAEEAESGPLPLRRAPFRGRPPGRGQGTGGVPSHSGEVQ